MGCPQSLEPPKRSRVSGVHSPAFNDVPSDSVCLDNHRSSPHNRTSLQSVDSLSTNPSYGTNSDNGSDNGSVAGSGSTTTVHSMTSHSNSSSFQPKLQNLANSFPLNATIPETEAVDGVDLVYTQTHSPSEDQALDDIKQDMSPQADLFNRKLSSYNITSEMEANIDQLIADKVVSLQKETQYLFLESAVCSLAGKKNGKTKTNQDAYIMQQHFGPSDCLQFFGVCDGHGPSGHSVSKYCAEWIPKMLVKDKTSTLTTLCKPGYALIQAFEQCEQQLHEAKATGKLKFDLSASGTTVSCGLRVGNELYLANLGDSRAVMGSYDVDTKRDTLTLSKIKVRATQMTVDHDPKNSDEAERIHKSKKGKLMVESDGTSRIQINLVSDKKVPKTQSLVDLKEMYGVDALKQLTAVSASVSRSIGDKLAQHYGGVISRPDVIIHQLNDCDLFVMWASDGIWTVIDNGDVTRIIGNKLKTAWTQKTFDDLQKMTNRIVREAHIVWQDEFEDYVDDITAVIARIGTKKVYES